MSHLTHIRTTIKNAGVLESVLRKMIEDGLENVLVGATLEKNVTTHCFENYKTIDFVILYYIISSRLFYIKPFKGF